MLYEVITRLLAEEILETAAVDLPRRRRQDPADAEFGAAVEVAASVAEEETEPELADVFGVQMRTQAEHVGEISYNFV